MSIAVLSRANYRGHNKVSCVDRTIGSYILLSTGVLKLNTQYDALRPFNSVTIVRQPVVTVQRYTRGTSIGQSIFPVTTVCTGSTIVFHDRLTMEWIDP